MSTCRDGTFALLAEDLPNNASCALTGLSRSGFYRRRKPALPNALTAGERDELVAVLNSRATRVQYRPMIKGQERSLEGRFTGRSGPVISVIGLLPELTARVRFRSPASARRG